MASRPFNLDGSAATSGTSPLAITGIAFDPSGNLGMTGYTVSDVDMPGSSEYDDALLAKYDAAGNHTLSKLFGDDSNRQAGRHIVFDADCNMFLVRALVTSSRFDMFLDKLDSAGNPLWSKRLNAGYEADWNITSIAVDPATGGVVFMGRYAGDLDLGGGLLPWVEDDDNPTRAYVAKFDAMGQFVWSKPSPRSSGRYMPGGIMAVDTFTGTLDADGTALGAEDGAERQFVVRLDRDGHISWSHILSPEFSSVQGLAVDPEGNVAIVGHDASASTTRSIAYLISKVGRCSNTIP
ncbi:hypothetical protein WME79_08275 [Sorangium sp. So ce726]|uniref:hypothetical protein n=1 Tax=Sorangium sp. So ce726 TaxID=3133319 RepID=UPI003F60EBA9